MNTANHRIILYGAHWCPDCRQSKQFLGENQIPYEWVNIETDKAGENFVVEKNKGKRIIPTIVFPDGSFLVEPSNAELAAKLNLKTEAEKSHYPLIIVGGGPAGLTAALYTAREGIDTLVIEKAAIGGQAAATQWLDNVPGFAEGIAGIDFCDQLRKQTERFGVEILQAQDVVNVFRKEKYHHVQTADGSEYTSKALLITSGSHYKRLNVPGESEYIGAGIHFCATCDGPFYKGERIVVVGGGNSAAEESVFLLNFVEHVTMLVRDDRLKASQILIDKIARVENKGKIDVRYYWEAESFTGSGGKLTEIMIKNNQTGEKELINPAGVFIFIGLSPNNNFLKQSGVLTNKWGFIITGHDLIHGKNNRLSFVGKEPASFETNIPGIFAAGDVRSGSTKQVASAAGEGAAAALSVREFLKTV